MRRRPSRVRALSAALAALAAFACGGDDGTGPQEPTDVTFDAAFGINLAQMTKLASGVYYKTTTAGTGTASVGSASRITGTYKGSLPNGGVFGQGALTNNPVSGFIPGFTDGVIGMKKGEVRLIVIPSRLGYADAPPPGSTIPSNSVLVFEVAVTDFAG